MTVVRLLGFDGCEVVGVSERSVVVGPVDPLGGGDLEVVGMLPRPFVARQLCLEQLNAGQRIVIRVAGAANRGDCIGVGEALGVAHGELLTGSTGSLQHCLRGATADGL